MRLPGERMSDKHLREKAVKSDRKMRSTPIAELYFQFYFKEVSKKRKPVMPEEFVLSMEDNSVRFTPSGEIAVIVAIRR
jgi:hypothetical protein